jgi:hypothetical protein
MDGIFDIYAKTAKAPIKHKKFRVINIDRVVDINSNFLNNVRSVSSSPIFFV